MSEDKLCEKYCDNYKLSKANPHFCVRGIVYV